MEAMIFESHAHYDDEQFEEDRTELLNSMQENGIGTIINVGATFQSCTEVVQLAQEYPFIYAAVGVHPDEVGILDEEKFAYLREQCKREIRLWQLEKLDLTIIGITNLMRYRKNGSKGSLNWRGNSTFRSSFTAEMRRRTRLR